MATILDYDALITTFPKRHPQSNKGDHGHVLIVGAGDRAFAGAVCLSGEAALRSGAGLVSIIVAPQSYSRVCHAPFALMIASFDAPSEAISMHERATTLVLGPGLSQNEWGKRWFLEEVTSSLPKVIDADGLNWLAKFPQKLEKAILTPHPGEAARLLNTTTEAIQRDREAAAFALHQQFNSVIVLKGARTLVVTEDKTVFVQNDDIPSLATAGTGDVLAGVIGALVAQGMSLSDAAKLGVCVHALAGKDQQQIGSKGMMAHDLFMSIRQWLNP